MTKDVDWEAIEREYRAGQLSIREIGRTYGVGAPAIVKRAKKLKWERDLSENVRETVNAKLLKETAAGNTSGNTSGNTLNARETVDAAAARGVEVVLRHRRDISTLDALKSKLVEKAATLLDGVASLDALGDAASAIESLSRTVGRLIPLERQAFNLNDKGDTPADGVIQLTVIDYGKSTPSP